MRRPLRVLLLALIALAVLPQAFAKGPQENRTVEVIEVKGLIDGSVEKAVTSGIRNAQDKAVLIVLQIDSTGILDEARTDRMTEAIHDSDVPVVAWVGPPGSRAANGAALLVQAADVKAMSPGSVLGPLDTLDMRTTDARDREATVFDDGLSAADAEEQKVIDINEPALELVVEKVDEPEVDLDDVTITFRKLDILGRVLHAAAQPSIAYLLLLIGLFAVTFELMHPSNGPAGVSGLVALGFSIFGIFVLHGSWIAVVLIVLAQIAFVIDLRNEALGPFTFGAIAALIAGSLLLFPSAYLSVSPWILALGIIGLSIFMVSVMTRVMRDLKLVAEGMLEVRDAHEALTEEGNDDDA